MDLLSAGSDAASIHHWIFLSTAMFALIALALLHLLHDRLAPGVATYLHLGIALLSFGLVADAMLQNRQARATPKIADAARYQNTTPVPEPDPPTPQRLIRRNPPTPSPIVKASFTPPAPQPLIEASLTPPAPQPDETTPPTEAPACHPIPAPAHSHTRILHLEKVDWNSRKISRYDKLFRKYTRKYFGENADWRWFKVQAFVESSMNPSAVSRSGAIGLMQILPSSFRQIQKMNRFFRGKSLRNPEWNIAAGIYYNRYLMQRWSERADPANQLQLMFVSYNAGVNHVARKISRHRLDPETAQRHLKRLPRETRRYLEKIDYYMEQYRGVAFAPPETVCQQKVPFQPLEMTSALTDDPESSPS